MALMNGRQPMEHKDHIKAIVTKIADTWNHEHQPSCHGVAAPWAEVYRQLLQLRDTSMLPEDEQIALQYLRSAERFSPLQGIEAD